MIRSDLRSEVARCHQGVSAVLTRTRAKIKNVVGAAHDLRVVLNH